VTIDIPPDPFNRPDDAAMLAHVEHLFGGAHEGLVELAWNQTDERAVKHAQLYDTHNLDTLVEHAAKINSIPGCNVYIGAALRKMGIPRYARAKDADFLSLTALYSDLDEPGTVKGAKAKYGELVPTLVVVTGQIPHPRAQLWWKLNEPITDPALAQSLLKGMASRLDGDTTVTNPARVMRLAGSIAWPVKPGRVQEATDLLRPKAASYLPDQFVVGLGGINREPSQVWSGEPPKANGGAAGGEYDAFGHLTDGRETLMRDMVHVAILNWYRENPIQPTGHESLMRSMTEYEVYERQVAPQKEYAAHMSKRAALEEEGRGTTAWWSKWQYLMSRWDTEVAARAAQPNPNKAPDTGLPGQAAQNKSVPPGTPIILTAAQFMAGFRPPDYTVDGVIQKSYLYAMTARTGHGKTAVAMLLMSCIARGVPFHGKQAVQGGVLFFAGENPDDIRARYRALADSQGFEIDSAPVHFVDGVLDINANMVRICEEAARIPDLSLIVIDTKAAYFTGDEGNNNEQQMAFARMARRLINNCHPVKNAGQDNLVPLGGGAFLNEIDANLTLWAEDKVCTLAAHPDKWRGVSFESVVFELRVVTSEALKDTQGRLIPSVIAEPITEMAAERRGVVAEEDDKTVLRLLNLHNGAISTAGMARAAGWLYPDGSVAKSKAARVVERLKGSKFIYKYHGSKYRLTKKGAKLIGVKFETGEVEDDS
jgi:hypothetical protein